MELTNDIKAKVLAQYLGQKCQIEVADLSEIGYEDGINTLNGFLLDWQNELKSCNLILKPLSDITDKDAIAACEAGYPLAFMGNNKISKWKTERKNRFVSITTRYSAFSFEFDTEGCPLIDMYDDGGLSNVFQNEFAYQYLQSKGYDLPHYLLDGKTLHEAGLAIYENELN